MASSRETLNVVLVEGSVVMRIIKHCRENRPQFVSGQLLGTDLENGVGVTNSFPFISSVGEEENNEKFATEGANYISSMLSCLEEIKMETNVVGWYSSNYMGKFFNDDSLGTQFDYQQRNPNSVVLLYDPMKTAQGSLSLKAYRLTEPFMNLYKSKQFSKENLTKSGVSFDDIYVEIPVEITNISLASAFLLEVEDSGNNEPVDKLDASQSTPYLEKTLETLIDTLEDLGSEHMKFQFYQKNVQRQAALQTKWLQNRREGADEMVPKSVVEPSRLDSLVYTNQIDNYCQQIKQFSGNNFAKLWLLGGVSKDV
eukprot:TRINITY_DN2248_c0_g1_i2.p1 TRINITY_DN2248_c0_g1~~TRINITY_DN2248_c0_g1_i2.p1  ORF type:complete len:312 (+),score=100.74 TRINITY_DN2248_c0_g1_i2:138-1073(+)